MEHSWCSCSAMAVARAAVLLLRSAPLLRLSAIGAAAAPSANKVPVELATSLIYTRARLPHPDSTGFPVMVDLRLPSAETRSALP